MEISSNRQKKSLKRLSICNYVCEFRRNLNKNLFATFLCKNKVLFSNLFGQHLNFCVGLAWLEIISYQIFYLILNSCNQKNQNSINFFLSLSGDIS